MPELPEVETMRRGIAAIAGSRIEAVERTACRKKPILIAPNWPQFRRQVTGRTIERVDRLGKRVVIRLDNDDAIVLEPRMTGLVLLSEPPNQEHLRLRFRLVDGRADQLLYWDRRGLGLVRLLTAAEFDEFYGPRLGPDALATSPALLRERLSGSRRAIKVALLDQKAVAGIGNLYASEILHLAAIHPLRPCNRLRPQDWVRLHAAIESVLQQAIRYEGSTLSDGTYRNALNEAGGYQNHHRVYDRAGQACPTCQRGTVERIVQAQRSTFYCRQCQRQRHK